MICNKCEKESVCKLIDGSDVVKCAEFLSINPNDYTKNAGMTNEEALKRMKWTKGRTGITSEEAEAIGYAIEKLSNSNEDCISRSHFDERVRVAGGMVEYELSDDFKDGVLTVLEMMKTEPSIQPKPKTDEPMQVELEGDGYSDGELVYDYGKCPKCGWDFEYGDKDWEEPYCCHCGQRLKWFESEEQESDLGDYTDSIHNQFDNMTGSMNL